MLSYTGCLTLNGEIIWKNETDIQEQVEVRSGQDWLRLARSRQAVKTGSSHQSYMHSSSVEPHKGVQSLAISTSQGDWVKRHIEHVVFGDINKSGPQAPLYETWA